MRYMKEVLKKNRIMILVYISLGIFNAFMSNYKVDYFQKIIDGLADGTLPFMGIIIYGLILVVNYCMNYLDQYPEKKLQYGIYLDFKLLALRKISTIEYSEYQKIGTGKLVQRIENGASAGRNVLFDFWMCLIRQLLPTIAFSIYFIWKINKKVTCLLLIGYVIIFIVTKEVVTLEQEKIGKFIAECRKAKGLTQMQIAEQLGITNRAISKWENGGSLS